MKILKLESIVYCTSLWKFNAKILNKDNYFNDIQFNAQSWIKLKFNFYTVQNTESCNTQDTISVTKLLILIVKHETNFKSISTIILMIYNLLWPMNKSRLTHGSSCILGLIHFLKAYWQCRPWKKIYFNCIV